MYPGEIVLLDNGHRHIRAAVLKARGYRVFTTEHVVEVCLRWVRGGCAALIIGPQIPLQQVATLCDWIKSTSPKKPILLLSDRRNTRPPVCIDTVILTQPAHALAEQLRVLLPATDKPGRCAETAAIRAGNSSGLPRRR